MHAHSLIDVGFLLSTVLCQGHSVSPHTCIVLICHAVSQCGLLMQVKVLSVKCALYAEVHAKGMVKNITYDQALLLFCLPCFVFFAQDMVLHVALAVVGSLCGPGRPGTH